MKLILQDDRNFCLRKVRSSFFVKMKLNKNEIVMTVIGLASILSRVLKKWKLMESAYTFIKGQVNPFIPNNFIFVIASNHINL